MFSNFPFYHQRDRMDCGPACLKMITKYYGRDYSLNFFRKICHLDKEGVSIGKLSDACEVLGFKTMNVRVSLDELNDLCSPPCILHWNHDHFVVLVEIKKKSKQYVIADPGHGILKISKEIFAKKWINGSDKKGIAFLLAPTKSFLESKFENPKKSNWTFIVSYILRYKKQLILLSLGVFLGNLLSLIFPFLTQILVDDGIITKNISLIVLIISSQLILYVGEIMIELIRGWLLLHVSTRVSITIVSDFLIKIMRLPVNFFDTKSTGDITQRIQDHERIESFLTGSSIMAIFSITNILILSVIIFIYNTKIFLAFFILSIISVLWIILFLRKRKFLDYIKFQHLKESQDIIFELINGMQEIKLNACEDLKKNQWEKIQINLFKLHSKTLKLEQYQNIGFKFINHIKNLIITYIAAVEVVGGNMTLGMLLSISYIIGQANVPLSQLVPFFRSLQDTKISIDRLNEIHSLDNEKLKSKNLREEIGGEISLKNVAFRYGGPRSPIILNDINMTIPEGKITAIVGTSGSGKTTLLKLLLKFYEPTKGEIFLNNNNFSYTDPEGWRKESGVVMQSGFIFSDSIENNITMGKKGEGNQSKMEHAANMANIKPFIDGIPLKYKTKLGNSGGGISLGQQQRILIARAIYKDPKYIFFDEATSALDANNEKIIIENLNQFFKGRTVVVIAHRLSTVKHADQIVVLEKGKITESGNHEELVKRKGDYYHLVKNQLELGT